jgi:hypothetical protein
VIIKQRPVKGKPAQNPSPYLPISLFPLLPFSLPPLLHSTAVLLLYGALFTAFFAPVLCSGRLLAPGDALHLTLPHLLAPRPLWSPLLFGGFPVMADPQNLTWYPPAWPVQGRLGLFNAFVVAAYVLASAFTCGFVRRLTGSGLGGFVAGTIYGLSGFMVGHLGHTNIIHAAAWTPLLLWSLEELRRRISAGSMVAAALATGCGLTAGHPQIPFYALLLGAAYVLALGWSAPAGRWRFGAASLGGVALGLALCGVLLVPMLELAGQSLRTGMSFFDFSGYALPARQLPQVLFPALFGGVIDPLTGAVNPYFGRGGGPAEANPFVGLVPLVLAGLGALLFRRRAVARFWLVVAVLALLLALGKETPLVRWTFSVPVYNRFRIQSRHLMEFALAVAVLAGFGIAGLQALDEAARRRLARHGFLVLAGVASLGLAFFAAVGTTGQYLRDVPPGVPVNLAVLPWRNSAVVVPLAVLVLGAVSLGLWARRPRPATAILLGVVVVLDLGSYAWCCEWRQVIVTERDLELPPALASFRDELTRTGQRLAPLYPFGNDLLALPNRARLWGLPCALGYSPLALSRYRELTGVDYIGFSSFHALKPDDRALDLLAVKYVLAPRDLLNDPQTRILGDAPRDLAAAERWRPVGELGAAVVFENRRAMPRAWLACEVVSLETAAMLRVIRTGQLPDGRPFDPAQTVLTSAPVSFQGRPDPGASVTITNSADMDLVLRTRSNESAFLVVSDLDYPGWEVTVNGSPARIVRVDHVLRGLRLPAGDNRVAFAFRPASYRWGLRFSGVSLAAIVALLARMLLASRRARRASPVAALAA